MRWPRWRNKDDVDTKPVIEEARSLLNGRIRATSYAGRWTIPAWVWVNQLAHADFERLVEIADSVDSRYRSHWDHACAFLASELLARGRDQIGIAPLQRVLVGVELELLDGSRSRIQTPNELIDVVCMALATSGFSRPDA